MGAEKTPESIDFSFNRSMNAVNVRKIFGSASAQFKFTLTLNNRVGGNDLTPHMGNKTDFDNLIAILRADNKKAL